MAITATDLYRSVVEKSFKGIKVGVYPGDGVLYPRFEDTQYFNKRFNEWRTSRADVRVVIGADGPQLDTGGGTSLHNVPSWFPTTDFWIPEGTEYLSEIHISKEDKLKTCPSNPKVKG